MILSRLKGFTLIEVMFALLIVALTMGAIVETGGYSARRTSQLTEKNRRQLDSTEPGHAFSRKENLDVSVE